MKTKTEKLPDYLKVSPEGVIYVDVDKWKHSPEREREIEHTEQLVEYLKAKTTMMPTDSKGLQISQVMLY